MRNKTPPASKTPALLAFGLVLFLGSTVAAQDSEPTTTEDPIVGELAEQGLTAEQPTLEDAAEELSPSADPLVGQSDEEPPVTEETPLGEAEMVGVEVVEGAEDDDAQIQVDSILPTASRERQLFQLLGLYELHFNIISDEHSANDWYSWYMLRGNFNPTDVDQISLRMDLLQEFVADPGESGLWFGDMRLYYSRSFTVPVPDFPLPAQASIYLTAPTSRSSQERSYITRPTASLTLAPSLGPFTLISNGFFRYSIASYAESAHGGDPNNLFTTGFWFQLFYQPFDWFAPSVAWQSAWYLDYPTREGDTQPWVSDYYFELALNFSIPMPEQAPSLDLSLAYAQGAGVLEGGVFQMYFIKRDQSEIYMGLNLTY